MAYQAKRKKEYVEEFQLVKDDGSVVKTILVKLDADSVVKNLSEKHVALVRALEDVRSVSASNEAEDKARGLEVLGSAVTDMLEAVFGAEDARVIVDFYEGRYIEMCSEVVPFITSVVIPGIRKIAKDNKKAALAGYGQRPRGLFGRK